ncbi:hypothetical protein CcI49_28580 [Frankia sp. CcI49]|uniref:effector-associated domain EAD1-containing protein n=1 Tax=Frankia sp. CcI49 TaxID=1745382 RepID=UPI0009784ABC|nr:effector-associated domain EAD1-containing protein [Frankia sp. CcI49]ONH55480.1 hypothetical protein CcI49_28580 [Frankia sp. CcI49]
MAEGLSDDEIDALAGAFFEPVAARHLLESAGLDRADHPGWETARIFWGEVSRLLGSGAVPDGRRRLLAEAAAAYPANEVFAATGATDDPARRRPGGEGRGWPVRGLADPFALGVHPAIDAGAAAAGLPPLPAYIVRKHDAELRKLVARAAGGASVIAVLVGESSTGKTRACWEAVQTLPEGWRLWHPISPEMARDRLTLIGARTVVWLDETQHYLRAGPEELGEQVAAGLRELLGDPDRGPVLVLGTIWPEYWAALTHPPRPGQADPHAQARNFLAGKHLTVPTRFTAQEIAALQATAGSDPRLADAQVHAADGQITQYLASAPELLARYDTAPPAARAVIEAAMDARRLGHGPDLPRALLENAAPGYLTDQQRDALDNDWFDQALGYTAVPCHGARGPLTPIRPRSGQPVPAQPCYRLVDYLEQHARGLRRTLPAAATLWDALAAHATPNDAARFAASAERRFLYRHAVLFFRRAAEPLLQLAADPGDQSDLDLLLLIDLYRPAVNNLIRLLTWRGDVDGLRALAGANAWSASWSAKGALARLLAERENVDGLRFRAHPGDVEAAFWQDELRAEGEMADTDTLIYWAGKALAQNMVNKLRGPADAGDRDAAEQLAHYLAELGDVDGLRARADTGDGAAARQLASILAERGQLPEAEHLLRVLADTGDDIAEFRLANLLTEHGRLTEAEQIVRGLVNAGDLYAHGQLIKLLDKQGRRSEAERLWRLGLNPDGSIASGLAG